jgi:hypothetical protein
MAEGIVAINPCDPLHKLCQSAVGCLALNRSSGACICQRIALDGISPRLVPTMSDYLDKIPLNELAHEGDSHWLV